MSKHPKADAYLADRAKGMSYRQVAEKHGVSYQAVYACCTKQDGRWKKTISDKGCIYPNLRTWLNADKPRQERFFRAMKGCCIRNFLNGTMEPKKNVIDRMLKLTGMRYEEMFAREEI